MAVENQILTVAVFDPGAQVVGLRADESVRMVRTQDAVGFAGAIGDADAVFLVDFGSHVLENAWNKRRHPALGPRGGRWR